MSCLRVAHRFPAPDADSHGHHRRDMRNGEDADDLRVHPQELNQEANRAGRREIGAEHEHVWTSVPAPPEQDPRERSQRDRCVGCTGTEVGGNP